MSNSSRSIKPEPSDSSPDGGDAVIEIVNSVVNSVNGAADDDLAAKENEEKVAATIERCHLAKEQITKHNKCIDELKSQVEKLLTKKDRTCVEQAQLECMQFCLRKEQRSLNDAVLCTINDRCADPELPWEPIRLCTTLEEDRMPRVICYANRIQASPSINPIEGSAVTMSGGGGADECACPCDALHEDIHFRDMMIACLQQKMRCIKTEMNKICKVARQACICKNNKQGMSACDRVQRKMCNPDAASACARLAENANESNGFRQQLDQMSNCLEQLQAELCAVQKERCELGRLCQTTKCPPVDCPPTPHLCPPLEMQELLIQHDILLTQYARKDRESAQLKAKVEALGEQGAAGCCGSDTEKIQIQTLNERIRELREEEEEFRTVVCDQQQQIADYRQKYLQAQETVAEQRVQMEKMQLTKCQIEKRIEEDVQKIKVKFQDKLRLLAPLPKMLEDEQFRCQTARQENEDLIAQMATVLAKLKKAKKELKKFTDSKADAKDAKKLQTELDALQRSLDKTLAEKAEALNQLRMVTHDLEKTKAESMCCMQRAQERAAAIKDALQKRINELEIELAETRAKISMTLADREDVICCMQDQLQNLSANFHDAQHQIQQLKQRMAHLNE